MKPAYRVGQRWLSVAEPELGLGVVTQIGDGRVSIRFGAVDEVRQYIADGAPLRRLTLRPGDRARLRGGEDWEVARAELRGGLIVYRAADGRTAEETELDDEVSGGGPEARLRTGSADPTRDFELRRDALGHQHRRRRSPVRGYVGGRMDLIPHQLFIAKEVTSRPVPRVLLADEVGLGKTVEACLIVHRLLSTGRASRVLVVVPEPLVHQWFVELLRRFNLWFHIFDEERCDAIEGADPAANPFLEDQLVLCALPLLRDAKRGPQAAAAGWDLLVVDEAHHLGWEPGAPGADYTAVEAVARSAEGLLLLTATPEQLGVASHFARLRLLDPHRFHDLPAFEQESARYVKLAGLASRLLAGRALEGEDAQVLEQVLGEEPESVRRRAESLATQGASARDALVQDLLDRHGTGRVMFRNTRSAMRGFPKRKPLPIELSSTEESVLERLAEEFDTDHRSLTQGILAAGVSVDLAQDPRLDWLVGFLRVLGTGKVLLICRSQAKVLALETALRARIAVKLALFHEGLELIQRDRNAAWFADPDGASILIASEIGSEGRNFQFAHHLVLFDLPLDPELIEQRIGRLDRIGQTTEIHIHVPYVRDSAQE
ncbi:MAG: RNA polymerase-associated protein RapA, partial [Verrucomicrobiales bacterium]|nr:RNA polymerase-associated protein RapA [Verrucomicrobiales bacterium]